MLIIALVLAVVSLAALVTAVVTSNELIAWVCIGFSALGVLLLIIDAIRDRHHRLGAAPAVLAPDDRTEVIAADDSTAVIEPLDAEAVYPDYPDYPDDYPGADFPDADDPEVVEDHPDEVIFDEPEYDTPSDDEPVYPMPAEEAAVHTEYSEYSEYSEQPYSADSATVIYAAEPSAGESATLTESYVVIHADEAHAVAVPEESSAVVIYADGTDDAETGGSAVRYESGSER